MRGIAIVFALSAVFLAAAPADATDACIGGPDALRLCNGAADCRSECEGDAGRVCSTDPDCPVHCVGGADAGLACNDDADCDTACVGGFDDGSACTGDPDCRGTCALSLGPCSDTSDCLLEGRCLFAPGVACTQNTDCPPHLPADVCLFTSDICENPGTCSDPGTCSTGVCDVGSCELAPFLALIDDYGNPPEVDLLVMDTGPSSAFVVHDDEPYPRGFFGPIRSRRVVLSAGVFAPHDGSSISADSRPGIDGLRFEWNVGQEPSSFPHSSLRTLVVYSVGETVLLSWSEYDAANAFDGLPLQRNAFVFQVNSWEAGQTHIDIGIESFAGGFAHGPLPVNWPPADWSGSFSPGDPTTVVIPLADFANHELQSWSGLASIGIHLTIEPLAVSPAPTSYAIELTGLYMDQNLLLLNCTECLPWRNADGDPSFSPLIAVPLPPWAILGLGFALLVGAAHVIRRARS